MRGADGERLLEVCNVGIAVEDLGAHNLLVTPSQPLLQLPGLRLFGVRRATPYHSP